MPRVDGLAEFGRNRVHLSEVDGWVEHAAELVTLPAGSPSPPELAIARHVAALVDDGATLQFGIGAIPDEVARLLASGPRGDLGIHTEMVSDGVMRLHAAGTVYLHPWTGPLYALPEPALALLVGHNVAYYASPRA